MYFVLTFVALCAVGYLLWRAFGPVAEDNSTPDHPSRSGRTPPPIGPDDDPDFLFGLNRRGKRDDST